MRYVTVRCEQEPGAGAALVWGTRSEVFGNESMAFEVLI